jgi:hypothetical protein
MGVNALHAPEMQADAAMEMKRRGTDEKARESAFLSHDRFNVRTSFMGHSYTGIRCPRVCFGIWAIVVASIDPGLAKRESAISKCLDGAFRPNDCTIVRDQEKMDNSRNWKICSKREYHAIQTSGRALSPRVTLGKRMCNPKVESCRSI